MREAQPTPAGRPRRLVTALALVLSLLAAVGLVVSSPASAASAPTALRITAVRSDAPIPGEIGAAAPTLLAKVNDIVRIDVSLVDATNTPAYFTKDTTVTVTSNRGGPKDPKDPTSTTGPYSQTATIPKNVTSATLNVSFPTAANGIVVTVKVPAKGSTPAFSDTTQNQADKIFDIVSSLQTYKSSSGTALTQGLGGDGTCQSATLTNPVCGVLVLPHGAVSSNVALSIGACDNYGSVTCPVVGTKGQVVQALANLNGLYSRTDPATLIVKCDRSLCGGGRIADHHVFYSQAATGQLLQADACPAKGTMADPLVPCVDYVQSSRDGSQDTLLFLLFTDDMRGIAG